jgi:CubicO group peptidase (beta-lactamase class C family)
MTIKVQQRAYSRSFLITLGLFAGCLGYYSCTPSQPLLSPHKFAEARTQQLDEFVSDFKAAFPVPGLAVAIVSADSVYYTSTGVMDDTGRPFTVNTPFMAGSISEPMLATAVLKLAGEGRLGLDDAVIKHLPYFKMGGNSYQKISIRHLLTHTSGIQHYNMMFDTPNFKANALEVTTKSIASQEPKFKVAGSRVSRSPYNYDILADLVSKVTGQPFENYVKINVFETLNMHQSSFNKMGVAAMPHHINNWMAYTTKQDTIYPYNRENGGSGGLHTTAKDMSKWMFNILNKGEAGNAGLTPQVYDNLLTEQFKTGKAAAIGYGWDIKEEGKEKIFIKGSQYGGFSSQVILIPGKKIGVMVGSNLSGDFNPATFARLVAVWLNGRPLKQPKIPVSMAMGKAFAKSGDIQDAFKIYASLKLSDPQKYDFGPAALSQFGTLLLHRVHNKQRALDVYRFCVAQFPSSAYAYLNLAEGYVSTKDLPNVRKAILKAKLLPDDSGTKARYLAYLIENLEILEESKS